MFTRALDVFVGFEFETVPGDEHSFQARFELVGQFLLTAFDGFVNRVLQLVYVGFEGLGSAPLVLNALFLYALTMHTFAVSGQLLNLTREFFNALFLTALGGLYEGGLEFPEFRLKGMFGLAMLLALASLFALSEQLMDVAFDPVGALFLTSLCGLVQGGFEFSDLVFEGLVFGLFSLGLFVVLRVEVGVAMAAFAVGEHFLDPALNVFGAFLLSALLSFVQSGFQLADLGLELFRLFVFGFLMLPRVLLIAVVTD